MNEHMHKHGNTAGQSADKVFLSKAAGAAVVAAAVGWGCGGGLRGAY